MWLRFEVTAKLFEYFSVCGSGFGDMDLHEDLESPNIRFVGIEFCSRILDWALEVLKRNPQSIIFVHPTR